MANMCNNHYVDAAISFTKTLLIFLAFLGVLYVWATIVSTMSGVYKFTLLLGVFFSLVTILFLLKKFTKFQIFIGCILPALSVFVMAGDTLYYQWQEEKMIRNIVNADIEKVDSLMTHLYTTVSKSEEKVGQEEETFRLEFFYAHSVLLTAASIKNGTTLFDYTDDTEVFRKVSHFGLDKLESACANVFMKGQPTYRKDKCLESLTIFRKELGLTTP